MKLQEWCERKALVFDLDGTLVDTIPDLTVALNRALAELGLEEVDRDLVAQSLHEGLEGSVDAALKRQAANGTRVADPALRGELLRRYDNHYALNVSESSRAFAGVEDVLARLRRQGAALAVCTNKSQVLSERLLSALGLIGYFDAVIGALPQRPRKPAPQPLWEALQRLGSAPAGAVLVGDSWVDVHCARAAGVDCLIHGAGYGRITTAAPGIGRIFHAYSEWLV